jgi:sigma-E factor negative regulatory protein RseB
LAAGVYVIPKSKAFRGLAGVLYAALAINIVAAQPVSGLASESTWVGAATEKRTINDWLIRTQEASKKLAYVGTFVVSSGGAMSSARVWHACEGDQQIERVETLSGAPRSVFRHNDQVVTFLQDQKVVRTEKRELLGLFPDLLQSTDGRIADFYKVRQEGMERVAGVEADIILLVPRDALRFGYRVWTEQKRGLVVKLQTLDASGKVLEQAAFSELEMDAPVKLDKLLQMMGKVDGYRLEKPVFVKTTPASEGWNLRAPVAGFKSMSSYRRPAGVPGSAPGSEALQWIFSDGLASVSVFVEPFDKQRHEREASLSTGATQTMTRQNGAYWLTLVGEVPMTTLRLFADNLERRK